jgi:hypothetical protein
MSKKKDKTTMSKKARRRFAEADKLRAQWDNWAKAAHAEAGGKTALSQEFWDKFQKTIETDGFFMPASADGGYVMPIPREHAAAFNRAADERVEKMLDAHAAAIGKDEMERIEKALADGGTICPACKCNSKEVYEGWDGRVGTLRGRPEEFANVPPVTPFPHVEECMNEWVGARCDSYDEGCPVCDAWHEFDQMVALAASAEERERYVKNLQLTNDVIDAEKRELTRQLEEQDDIIKGLRADLTGATSDRRRLRKTVAVQRRRPKAKLVQS